MRKFELDQSLRTLPSMPKTSRFCSILKFLTLLAHSSSRQMGTLQLLSTEIAVAANHWDYFQKIDQLHIAYQPVLEFQPNFDTLLV